MTATWPPPRKLLSGSHTVPRCHPSFSNTRPPPLTLPESKNPYHRTNHTFQKANAKQSRCHATVYIITSQSSCSSGGGQTRPPRPLVIPRTMLTRTPQGPTSSPSSVRSFHTSSVRESQTSRTSNNNHKIPTVYQLHPPLISYRFQGELIFNSTSFLPTPKFLPGHPSGASTKVYRKTKDPTISCTIPDSPQLPLLPPLHPPTTQPFSSEASRAYIIPLPD